MTTHPDYINAAFKGGSFQKNVVSGRENGANSPDQGPISTRLKRCSQKLEQFVLIVSAECQARASSAARHRCSATDASKLC